jgi:hypothetical protein
VVVVSATMLTLRDINRALDRLGVEAFAPHTARRAAREDHSMMNALREFAARIERWRLRRIARRRLRRLIRHEQIVSTVPLAPARCAVSLSGGIARRRGPE